MSYEYDLFISYAHIDDLSPFGGEKGWIDLLHERLSVLLAQALGYELKIWRDGHSLRGNDDLSGAIGEGVTRSLLLLPIISPRYVQSAWCNREMATFHAAPPLTTNGVAPAFRSRVFKVIKTPLPDHLKSCEPEHIRDLIGYQFYGEDESSGVLTEFSPDPSDKQYWKTLNRLVADIKRTLIELKHAPGSAAPVSNVSNVSNVSTQTPETGAPDAAAPRAPGEAHAPADNAHADAVAATAAPASPTEFVFLAETTGDLAHEREALRDELRQRGYGVLPEQRLPLDERRRVEEAVRADLARCRLSVHMVGARYGSTPEDDAASVVLIQERLAAERGAGEASFQRLFWMPPGLGTPALEVADARQKSFIETLQSGLTAGAELLQTTIEDLKTRAVEKLSAKPQAAAGAGRGRKLKQVYLICENRDREFIRPIKQYLFREQFEVITWLEGEAGAERLTDYHRKNLRECDAALIYFGNGDEPWVRKNLEDLEKAYGYGREDDWTASAVYVGQPPSEQKEDFLTHMVPYVIHNLSGFNPDDLRDFVTAVRAAEGVKP